MRGLLGATAVLLALSCSIDESGGAPGGGAGAGGAQGGQGGAGGVGWPDAGGAGGSGGTGAGAGGAGDASEDSAGGSGGVAGWGATGGSGGASGSAGSGVGGSGGTTAWTPASVPGCVLWLDAADPGATLITNGAVQIWKDKCVGHDASTTGSHKPKLTDQLLAGKPGVQFDGVDDFLEVGGASVAAPGFDLFFVVRTASPGGFAVWSNRGTALSPPAAPTYFGVADLHPYVYQDTAMPGGLLGTGSLAPTAMVYELAVGTGGRRILVGGAVVAADASTQTATSVPGGFLGFDTPNNSYHAMDVFEVVMYAGELDPTTASGVRGKLASKWGIP